jgi:hypothetical protein
MALPLQLEDPDSPQARDARVLVRQHHSSTAWFDGAVTGYAAILRLVVIVVLVVMLSFVGVIWFSTHPLSRIFDYRWPSPHPVVVPRAGPEPPPTPVPTPVPNP